MRWVGTPYRHQGSLRDVGCDCLGLVRGVWRALIGPEPVEPPAYTPDWAETGGPDAFLAAARRHLGEVPVVLAGAGDVLLFRWRTGLPAKHAAILITADRFVHAQQGASVAAAALSPWWRRRIAAAFRFPGVID